SLEGQREGHHHRRAGLHRPPRRHCGPGRRHYRNPEALMFDHELREAAEQVLLTCRKKKLKVVTAESCTGGLIAAALTAIAGSSDVGERGFVTYSNEAKREMIGVPWDAILGHGAVSEPV